MAGFVAAMFGGMGFSIQRNVSLINGKWWIGFIQESGLLRSELLGTL